MSIPPCTCAGSLDLVRRGTDPGDPYTYSIHGVGPLDTGLYRCVAGNILGETVETAYLSISGSNIHTKTAISWMFMASLLCTVESGVVMRILMMVMLGIWGIFISEKNAKYNS